MLIYIQKAAWFRRSSNSSGRDYFIDMFLGMATYDIDITVERVEIRSIKNWKFVRGVKHEQWLNNLT